MGPTVQPVRTFVSVLALLFTPAALQCAAVPGKFFEYYQVAITGSGGLTAIGTQPSINDYGQVSFIGTDATGESVWVGNGLTAARSINPGSANAGRIFFGQAAQINNKNQVVAQDRLTGNPASTDIRIWDASSTDSLTNVVRGGPGQSYDAVFAFPSINNNGDVAATGLLNVQRFLFYIPSGGSVSQALITSASPQPMIADDGSIVMRVGTTSTSLRLYAPGLASFQTIADTSTTFNSIDNDPGISRDGKVVVFMGDINAGGALLNNTNAGPGIFASIDDGSGTRKLVRLIGRYVEDLLAPGGNKNGNCDTGETCKPAAELGYDNMGNALFFASYAADTKVAVSNLDLGAAGIDDNSFVVAFVATPNGTSRGNPVLPGKPLLFSNQTGLWTMRVDVDTDLSGTTRRYHPQAPLPVAQVNDTLMGKTISQIGVFSAIGFAAKDESGNIRTMRRGDHRVAFWAAASTGEQMIVRANHIDSDQDGLLDFWETAGIDVDQDGVADLNLGTMGSNPAVRDVFLEMDWLSDQPAYTFQPGPGVTQPLPGSGSTMGPFEQMFRGAPNLTGAMFGARIDGSPPASITGGIVPHIDVGNWFDPTGQPYSLNMGMGSLQGGDPIGMPGNLSAQVDVLYYGLPNSLTVPGVNTRSLHEVKDLYFGTTDKRAREFAFHYFVMGFAHSFKGNPPFVDTVASYASNTITGTQSPPAASRSGDLIKITGGRGAGQFSGIQGFTSSNAIVTNGFATTPDTTSTYTILSGSTGRGESFFYPSPDFHAMPGNDVLITFDGFSVAPVNGFLGPGCPKWRTMAHELGHNLGLRHGGIDQMMFKGNAYLSIMSYSHQLQCVPASPVQSYSGASDPTFNDWANLRMDFSNTLFHLGGSLGRGYGSGDEFEMVPDTQQTIADYQALNGPLDAIAPAVSITSPVAGGNAPLGAPLIVNVTASDNVAVSSVAVTFDLAGDGVGPSDTITAASTGGNTYRATFGNVTGPAGNRTVKAFAVDSSTNLGLSSITISVGSTLASTSTGLIASASVITAGQNLTLTATVTGSGGTPTGSVTFKDGASTLNTVPLTSGTAVLMTTSLTGGVHSLTAVYSGDSNFATSTSSPVSVTVNTPLAATSTTLASSLNPSNAGQSVTFTATVTGAGGTPTGTVTFMDGSTTLGALQLTGGAAQFTTSTLTAGQHSITALYGGDSAFATSSSAPLTQVVNSSGVVVTATTLASSLNPSNTGQSVTLRRASPAGAARPREP